MSTALIIYNVVAITLMVFGIVLGRAISKSNKESDRRIAELKRKLRQGTT